MASIYPQVKNGKIVSFKFKVFLGRDEKGKRQFKCKTWIPTGNLPEKKLKQQAKKEAVIWEREVLQGKNDLLECKENNVCTFNEFVKNIWMPAQLNLRGCKTTTIAFKTYLLKVILIKRTS
ncbi:MAG: hypothetical protein IJ391_04105 [Clostridia bacterium]|nr:hypothetical protein [Clostridia bacterium]